MIKEGKTPNVWGVSNRRPTYFYECNNKENRFIRKQEASGYYVARESKFH